MKDAFKIKKGLNVQPTDPAEVVNPEAGDIIVDSTDDNRMKVYDPTAGEFSAVGTGGSSGNILADIEKLTPTVTNVVTTIDTTVFLPIDDNNKSVKATFSGSDGTIRYEAPASADLDGVQGVVKVWIKTDVEGLSLVATKDGVAQNNGLTINSTNKWRQYEIPVVLGDADYGFEIQASGAVSGDVYIDEAFVKVEQVTQNVGQAHFVGSLKWDNGTTTCIWQNTAASYSSFSVDNDCQVAANYPVGNILEPSTKIPAIKIPNARTDGYYQIKTIGLLSSFNSSTCGFSLSTDSGVTIFGETYAETNTTGVIGLNSDGLQADIKFETTGDKQVEIVAYRRTGTGDCRVYGRGDGLNLTFTVHFFPDSNSTIVSQNTELTAKTANELNFTITNSASIEYNGYNALSSCSKPATGSYRCLINTNINSPLSLTANVDDGNAACLNGLVRFFTNTTSEFNYNVRDADSGALIDCRVNIQASKRGADVNKSQTIVGKFENINSSDLIQMKYDKITVQVIPNGSVETILFDNSIYDNSNGAYNPATGIFTAPRDGTYKICASWMYEAAVWGIGSPMWHYVGDQIPKRFEVTTTNSDFYSMFGCDTVKLSQGETQPIARAEQGSGSNKQNIASSGYNYFTLEEQATYEAIVKNLSNQKTKCQTKKFTGVSYTGTGIISQLVFNNVDTSKYYSFHAKIQSDQTNSASTDKYVYMNLNGFETIVSNSNDRNGGDTTSWMVNQFNIPFTKPTSTTVSVSITAILNMQTQYGYATLCELPDTYVETTKF